MFEISAYGIPSFLNQVNSHKCSASLCYWYSSILGGTYKKVLFSFNAKFNKLYQKPFESGRQVKHLWQVILYLCILYAMPVHLSYFLSLWKKKYLVKVFSVCSQKLPSKPGKEGRDMVVSHAGRLNVVKQRRIRTFCLHTYHASEF